MGMLPDRTEFEWLRISIYKVNLGDGPERFSISYRQGTREVQGSGLETIDNLEAGVRDFVALDWRAIEKRLQTEER